MRFNIDSLKNNGYGNQGYGGSGGSIVIGGGGSGSNYIHPLSTLWGNPFQAGDTLDGDIISRGKISAALMEAEQGNFTNIAADIIEAVTANLTNIFSENIINTGQITTDEILGNHGNFKKLEADDATIRNLSVTGAAHFVELVIDKINSTEGSLLLSPAHCEISRTEVDGDKTRCYWLATDGKKDIVNDFQVDDLVICNEFNVREGVNKDIKNKFIWKRITEVGTQYYFKDIEVTNFVASEINGWDAYDADGNMVENMSDAAYIKKVIELGEGHYKVNIKSTSVEDMSYEFNHEGGEFEFRFDLDFFLPSVTVQNLTLYKLVKDEEKEPENYFEVYTDNSYKVGEYNHKYNNNIFEEFDIACVLGNWSNPDRQKAILLSSTNPKWLDIGYSEKGNEDNIIPINSPAIITFDKVDRFSLANKHVSVLSPTYNLITANSVSGLSDIIKDTTLSDEDFLKAIDDLFNGKDYLTNNVFNEWKGTEFKTTNDSITALAGRVSTNEAAIAALDITSEGITALVKRVEKNEGDITALTGNLSVEAGKISALVSKQEEIDGNIESIQSKIEQIPDNIDMYVQKGDLETVGIHLDGENSTITAVADQFKIVNQGGDDVAYTDAEGNFTVEGNLSVGAFWNEDKNMGNGAAQYPYPHTGATQYITGSYLTGTGDYLLPSVPSNKNKIIYVQNWQYTTRTATDTILALFANREENVYIIKKRDIYYSYSSNGDTLYATNPIEGIQKYRRLLIRGGVFTLRSVTFPNHNGTFWYIDDDYPIEWEGGENLLEYSASRD